jgi:hypothetical protein
LNFALEFSTRKIYEKQGSWSWQERKQVFSADGVYLLGERVGLSVLYRNTQVILDGSTETDLEVNA